jgi:hypothetical protein
MTLKEQYQYRRYNKKAEGEKDKNCQHCKNPYHDTCNDIMCPVIDDWTGNRHLCDKFERG